MSAVVGPDVNLLGLFTSAVDPYLLLEIELQRSEPVAGEQQVLRVDQLDERIICETDLKGPGSVAIVDQTVIVAGLEVHVAPGAAPPAGGHADLRILALQQQVEGLGLHLFPDILGNGVDLLAGGIALGSEAILAAPGNTAVSAVVGPDRSLDDLGMSAAVDPDVLGEVELQRGEPVAGEQQMLGVDQFDERIT